MTWLVRCLVRDYWTSCFFTSRLTLDDHALASSPRLAVRNLAFDKTNDKSFHSIHHKILSRPSKKCNNNNRQLNNPIVKDKDGVAIGNRFGYSSWSFSADEEYIVLCFGKDGAFDVVKDDKGVKSEALIRGLDGMHKNSRPLNRKLKYGEDTEQANKHEKRSNANQHNIDPHDQEDEEKEMVYKGRDSMRRACQVEGIEDCGKLSVESRDSVQSEGSTGSFAFPVLGWEWIGSPAQMPKSEGLHLKKQEARSVRFQCCTFL